MDLDLSRSAFPAYAVQTKSAMTKTSRTSDSDLHINNNTIDFSTETFAALLQAAANHNISKSSCNGNGDFVMLPPLSATLSKSTQSKFFRLPGGSSDSVAKEHVENAGLTPNAQGVRAKLFLRAMIISVGGHSIGASGMLEPVMLQQLADFCAQNDPLLVEKYHQTARAAFLHFLEQQARSKITRPAPAPYITALLQATAQDFSRAVGSLTVPHKDRIPKFSVSQCHFVFISSAGSTAKADADVDTRVDFDPVAMSCHVRLTNEGKHTFRFKVAQQEIFIVPLRRSHASTLSSSLIEIESSIGNLTRFVTFNTSSDRNSVQSGDAATIAISLSVDPQATAVLSHLTLFVVLNIEDMVRVFLSVVVVNPHQRVFRVPQPVCCPANLTSPLGNHRVPAALAALRSVFRLRNGPTTSGLEPGAIYIPSSSLSPQYDSTYSVSDDKSRGIHSLNAYRNLMKEIDADGHFPLLREVSNNSIPSNLALLTPDELQGLSLLWLSLYPCPLLPPSIMSLSATTSFSISSTADCAYSLSDPIRFLAEEASTEVHSILIWVVDHCCDIIAGHHAVLMQQYRQQHEVSPSRQHSYTSPSSCGNEYNRFGIGGYSPGVASSMLQNTSPLATKYSKYHSLMIQAFAQALASYSISAFISSSSSFNYTAAHNSHCWKGLEAAQLMLRSAVHYLTVWINTYIPRYLKMYGVPCPESYTGKK